MSNLYITTVATEPKYYFSYLQESCKKNGKELVVLGYGEKWQGFNWRFKLVIEYLKTLKKNDIVCIIDGYDVVCTKNLNELKNVFLQVKKKYNCKIIVGNDKIVGNDLYSFFLNITIKNYYNECKNKSLNAGTYIGYVGDLMEILNKIYNLNPIDYADDQILLTKYCNLNPFEIHIDKDNEIFLSIVSPNKEIDNEIDFIENKVIYNNNSPFFVHAPGETYLDNVIIKMGYNYDYNNRVNKILNKKFYQKIYFYIIKNILKIIFLIILFSVLIYLIYYILYKKKYKKK